MKPGDLLVPNDYLRRNGRFIFGVVLEVTNDTWGPRYKFYLSNGITHWQSGAQIFDMFDIVETNLESG